MNRTGFIGVDGLDNPEALGLGRALGFGRLDPRVVDTAVAGERGEVKENPVVQAAVAAGDSAAKEKAEK